MKDVPPAGVRATPFSPHPVEERQVELISHWRFVRESPPWLLSAVVHMGVLIALALWLVTSRGDDMVSLEATFSTDVGELGVEMVDQFDVPEAIVEVLAVDRAQPLETSEIAPVVPTLDSLSSHNVRLSMAKGLEGRDASRREEMLEGAGGTAETEQAVIMGLRWLARNQDDAGFWSLKGPYRDGAYTGRFVGDGQNREAATAMALIAFQGHGHTHVASLDDPFDKNVRQGWAWLLKQQHSDGHFVPSRAGQGRLYTHAICTIALCELYGMTHDSELRRPAQQAIDYCVDIQTREGGWRYVPRRDSDLSVTGWFAMALQSARMAGLEVPSPTFDKLNKYLDSVQREYGSQYAYRASTGPTLSMTAEGLLCRQYLGWERDDQRLLDGTGLLLQNLPRWKERDVYYWYYATQVCHHMGGAEWKTWNNDMRVLLPKHQLQQGDERGSWNPQGDRYGPHGGRLYTTCLSIYILEVYYRHLPIYGADPNNL